MTEMHHNFKIQIIHTLYNHMLY